MSRGIKVMKTKSFLTKLQKLQTKIDKFVSKKKQDVQSVHSLRKDSRELLSLLDKENGFYPKLKKIIKLTNKIRDIDVFLKYYLNSLPKKYITQLHLDKIELDTTKSRNKKLLKLHTYLKSFKIPKHLKLKDEQISLSPSLNHEVPSLNQEELHKYRIEIKQRLYTELNFHPLNEQKVKTLTSIKDILGTINDNFNGLESTGFYDIDEKLFEQIREYTESENLRLFQEFKKLNKKYKKELNMKRLYIIRHAKSSWKDESLDDFERPLGKRGKADAPKMGKRLKKRGVKPDIIISSPAVRAKTTAELIAKELEYSKEILFKAEMYEASSEQLHSILREMDDMNETVFLFGHNPELNMLAQMYVGFEENIVTCGIVVIEFKCEKWTDISEENARFLYFDYPKNIYKI
jgi:phosphohistidine phosphatase